MTMKRILVIDDEEGFCNFIKENLEIRMDYVVDTALDGYEGIEKARKLRPNLILLDIRMPRLDGFKVLERLKKDEETVAIPVIMLSALSDDESKIKSTQLYTESYLTKPVEMASLISKIEEVLKRKGIE